MISHKAKICSFVLFASLFISSCSNSGTSYEEESSSSQSESVDLNSSSSSLTSSSSSSILYSSSDNTDLPLFSKFVSQFSEAEDNAFDFDKHVLAFNAYDISSSCEDAMIVLDEDEEIIPIQSISLSNIAECFPKSYPYLKEKILSTVESTSFYAIIVKKSASPQVIVLNELTNKEIRLATINPGGESCLLSAWGATIMFLIADTEGYIGNLKTMITNKMYESKMWKCEDNNHSPAPIKTDGEWFSDSLL